MTLQHYKFPDIFLRHTKKAFVSFLMPETLRNVKEKNHISAEVLTYSAIRHACRRKGIASCNLGFCRKIHGSWLHSRGGCSIEEVDFLQGRVSASIFSRHYLTPQLQNLKERVLQALEQLQRQLL
jgi:intergrase/recombinase